MIGLLSIYMLIGTISFNKESIIVKETLQMYISDLEEHLIVHNYDSDIDEISSKDFKKYKEKEVLEVIDNYWSDNNINDSISYGKEKMCEWISNIYSYNNASSGIVKSIDFNIRQLDIYTVETNVVKAEIDMEIIGITWGLTDIICPFNYINRKQFAYDVDSDAVDTTIEELECKYIDKDISIQNTLYNIELVLKKEKGKWKILYANM